MARPRPARTGAGHPTIRSTAAQMVTVSNPRIVRIVPGRTQPSANCGYELTSGRSRRHAPGAQAVVYAYESGLVRAGSA